MRTQLELDSDIINQVMNLGQFPSKKAAVNTALVEMAQLLKRKQLLALRGKVTWQGNLNALRSPRVNDANDTTP